MIRLYPTLSSQLCTIVLSLPGALAAAGCADDPMLGGYGDAGAGPAPDAAVQASSSPASPGGCSAVRGALLGQVDAVSSADVRLESAASPRIVYVDASAGGFQGAASSPYVYINLEHAERVNISDLEADTSLEWDLAFKRFTIRTNGGDSGSGQGGAAAYEATLDQVSLSTIAVEDLLADDFVDDETCEPIAANSSGVEGIATAFSSWYSYDTNTMILTPFPIVYVVRSARSNVLYKLQISDYYAAPSGGSGAASGRFRFAYQALESERSNQGLPVP